MRVKPLHCLPVAALLFVLAASSPAEDRTMTLNITSSAFSPNEAIPKQYTCEGKDTSPPLAWSGVPANAKSLALIVDDPDAPDPAAPRMTWVHWVLYNIPPTAPGLPEAVSPAALPPGTLEGVNDWQRTGYGGPCPPIGRHRYFHKLYALDTALPDLKRPTKAALGEGDEGARHRAGAARGHVSEGAVNGPRGTTPSTSETVSPFESVSAVQVPA